MATPGIGVQYTSGNRQRLRPWLIDQINSGNYPGVSWVDHEKMAFKVPWKHFGRPGVDEEKDAKIFREWARHTGKYKDGDPSDTSTWKTRFRCALHKLTDIEELHDLNMLDGDEPYRVYRFRSKDELESERRESTENNPTPSPVPSTDGNATVDGCGCGELTRIDGLGDFISEVPYSLPNNVLPMQHPVIPVQPVRPIFTPFVNLKIKLYNKSKEVFGPLEISNPTGCRIAYKAPPPLPTDLASRDNEEVVSHIYGPFQAQQVYFPDSGDMDTAKLLGFMKRGLVLQTHENDVYATRLCQAKIFYGTSQADDALPVELRREDTTKVFDFKNFMLQFESALTGNSRPPRADLYFCFGQRWGHGISLLDNLVYACVTHLLAEEQLKSSFSERGDIMLSEPNPLDVLAKQIDQLSVGNAFGP